MTHDGTGGGIPALRTTRLGKRYGQLWGLRDCTLTVPAGATVGLVGPNGGQDHSAGDDHRAAHAHRGLIEVFGHTAQANTAATLARVGYTAQNHPLYPDFSVADMFHLGQAMNPSWDMAVATGRMRALGVPLKRKVKSLSGGQHAQVSLAMALAKRAAARARRAGRQPRSGCPAGVPARGDGPGGRGRPHSPHRLARGVRT